MNHHHRSLAFAAGLIAVLFGAAACQGGGPTSAGYVPSSSSQLPSRQAPVLGATAPAISSVSKSAATKSDRLVIIGKAFGAPSGRSEVLVAGRVAPIASWTDSSITTYVPESAPLGSAAVRVVTTAGSSKTITVQLKNRRPAGRIAWRFEMAGMYAITRPAIAPDGTVYTVDVAGHLYALTPAGGLKWIFNGAGPKGLSIGADGTIYTGDETAITAVRPGGTMKWRYRQNPGAFILLGPNVGPDGNIYAVADEGLGVFSLTPTGKLRWSTPERYARLIVDYQEIVFGAAGSRQQLYFHANAHFKGIALSGQTKFTVLGDGSQPAVAPDGTVLTHTWTIGAGIVLYAYNPTTGQPKWHFSPSLDNVSTAPDVDGNGNTYVGWNLAYMYSLSPTGQQRWKFTEPAFGILNDPIVNPAATLVIAGGQPNYGQVGYFEAVNASNGTMLWKQSVGKDPATGKPVVPYSRARFSADGRMAFASAIVAGVNDHSFLFGIKTN
jgi:outer membrane protein assembly factor BamB